MEFNVDKKETKPLVDRDEVIIKIEKIEVTPSKEQVREAAAKLLKTPADLVVVKHIYQKFGETGARAEVYVYKTKEAMIRFEPKPKEKKKEEKKEEKPKEEKKEGEAPEEKTEEKPKEEEPKEEPKEQKPEEQKSEGE